MFSGKQDLAPALLVLPKSAPMTSAARAARVLGELTYRYLLSCTYRNEPTACRGSVALTSRRTRIFFIIFSLLVLLLLLEVLTTLELFPQPVLAAKTLGSAAGRGPGSGYLPIRYLP